MQKGIFQHNVYYIIGLITDALRCLYINNNGEVGKGGSLLFTIYLPV